MRVCVVGTGYVGLVVGSGLAHTGNDVLCVDVDEEKIAALSRGEVPIHEPGLADLVQENLADARLRFSTDVGAGVRFGDIIFVCVGTPPLPDGRADLGTLWSAAEVIGREMNWFKMIVIKSTVPVGTAVRVRDIIAQHARHRFEVIANPEFLKEGDAVNDFMKPDRIVIGTDSEHAREVLTELYAPFQHTSDRIILMDTTSAELTKYAANAFLATKISFMNEMAILADRVGADITAVRKALGADARIGAKFLFPGVGYGGSCFPKDVRALMHTAQDAGCELRIAHAVDEVNRAQPQVLLDKVAAHFGDGLEGVRVAVWGLAFKPNTDDTREAPALRIIDWLLERGAVVAVCDPVATAAGEAHYAGRVSFHHSPYDAATDAEAVILVTEWHQFRMVDLGRLREVMRTPTIFDGRNIYSPERLARMGFALYGIGRPTAWPDQAVPAAAST